jgi:hypothetical protein
MWVVCLFIINYSSHCVGDIMSPFLSTLFPVLWWLCGWFIFYCRVMICLMYNSHQAWKSMLKAMLLWIAVLCRHNITAQEISSPPPNLNFNIVCCPGCIMGRDSIVSIATRYGPNSQGMKSWWGKDFSHLSRGALGPTQPPVQWVQGLFPRDKVAGA